MKLFRVLVVTIVLLSTYSLGYSQELIPGLKGVVPPATQVSEQEPVEQVTPTPVVEKKDLDGEIAAGEKRLKSAEVLQELSMKEDWSLTMKDLASQNVDMAKNLIDTAEKSKKVQAANDQLEENLLQMRETFSLTKKRVGSMGLTPAVGALLQKRRLILLKQELPRQSAVQRRLEIRRVNQEELRLEGFEDYIESLSDEKIAEFLDVMNPPSGERDSIRTAMEKTLQDGNDLIHDLRAANARYLTILGNQSYAERAIKLAAKEFIEFINVQLLWARSNQSFDVEDVAFLQSSTAHVINPDEWEQSGSDSLRSLKRAWLQWSIIGLIFIGWFVFRFRRGKVAKKMASKLEVGGAGSIVASLKILVLSIVMAGILPLLIIVSMRLLASVPGCHEFTKAVTLGVCAFAKVLFFVSLARILLRSSGLGQTYLGWPESVCRSVRRFAWRCVVFIAPITFLLVTINTGFSIPVRGSLGRIVFFVEMIVLALILLPLVRQRGPIFSHLAERKTFLWKTRKLWLFLAIAAPLSFLVIAFLGYYRTAFLMSNDFLYTIVLVGALIFFKALFKRWSMVAKDSLGSEEETAKKTNIQTTILIRAVIAVLALVGLYQIWYEDMPVVSFLNSIILWTYHAGLDITQNPIISSTTLGDLFVCALILAFTYVITKNLYGLLNILFFKRLSINSGSQHATTLIVKYILAVIGLTFALSSIGIGWSKFQWLIAALTVGLSFGLQEIVANFVSGIILLFERPISIGDTIAVAGVEGKVTKIQIRATTVTDWDNKEVLIPNKAFLTTNITNWTLSDQVVRIVIPIGIAYGSDARLAEETLLKVATNNPLTLDKPAASVVFIGFGDNSLDFKLRTYSKSGDRMTTINQLHLEINDAFNTAGLEIPFPQRDVHMDSSKPIDVRVVDKGADA